MGERHSMGSSYLILVNTSANQLMLAQIECGLLLLGTIVQAA